MTRDLFPIAKRLVVSLCFLSAAITTASAQVVCPQAVAPAVPGGPVLNNQHVFCGQINSEMAAVGFHSRPAGVNPNSVAGGAVVAIPGAPAGIYRLAGFNVTQGLMTYARTSTMFPDACNQVAVVAAIRFALANGAPAGANQFIGPSGPTCQAGGANFNVRVRTNAAGNIVTGFPNY